MFALAEEYGHRYLGSLPRGGLSTPGCCAADLILRYGEARDAAEAAYRGKTPLVFAEDLVREVPLADSPTPPPMGRFRPEVYAVSCARLRHAVEALDGSAISSAFAEILGHLAQSADRDAARLGAMALEACIPFKERARALGLDPETSLPGLWPEVAFAEARSLGDISRAMPPFLEAFLRESTRLSGERREVADTKRWVLADLTHSFSVEEAAARVGMSPSNFAHVFKKDTGNSFIDFVNTVRMERARELLLGTDLLVRQVADAVGIESLSHFGQLFRRSCGVSPNELRNSRKGGRIPL
jgi:two-component system response regulator YesN